MSHYDRRLGSEPHYSHSDVLAQDRVDAGVVGSIEAKSDQVWLTDGLVTDRPAKSKRRPQNRSILKPADDLSVGWFY
jgi:hypothetical protein